MPITDRLWGGKLTRVNFDPVDHNCDLQVVVLDGGVTHAYEIECRSVTDLRFRSTIPEPWTYAEVSEANVGTDHLTGQQILDLQLWSDDAALVVRCASVEIRATS